MAFIESADPFLADFGVAVTAGAVSGLGILDMPGEYVADGRVITTEYLLRAEAEKFGNLSYDDALTVDGEAFTLRESPLLADDGVFCLLLLTKATPETVPTPQRPITETRIDTTTTGVIYVGQAISGAAEGSPVWTIVRTTYSAAGIRLTKGTATGVTWTGRAGHTYI
jgi:hypothetical protein